MSTDREQRILELFEQACGLPEDEHSTFLEDTCRDDPELRAEVERLLRHDRDSDSLPGYEPEAVGRLASDILEDSDPVLDQIGPYRIVRNLGRGGMGEVYLAEQTEPIRRQVALKLIKWGMDTRAVLTRFNAERKALGMMSHTHIARVLDAGATDRGRPYFVMEYVDGVPITTYCDRKRLTTRERVELFLQVCDGVRHSHRKGVLHMDLKPSNVLVTEEDGKPVPKIIDFGIARAIDQRTAQNTIFTQHGQVVGTPEYMSPEQADPAIEDLDTRTDVYSLGVLLYELLSGVPPLDPKELRGAGYEEMQRRIREEEPSRPSARISTLGGDGSTLAKARQTDLNTWGRQLRGDLDWIALGSLEKDRERRYGSVEALEEDLRRHLNDEPISQGPPNRWHLARKFVRRHRFGVALASALAVSLLVGGIGTTIGMVRARRAEAEALREARTSQRVTELLVSMFDKAEQKGIDHPSQISALSIVDAGAREIREGLEDEPLVRASVLNAIAEVYESLQKYDEAEVAARESLELRQRHVDTGDPKLADSLSTLGKILVRTDHDEEAEPYLTTALDIYRTRSDAAEVAKHAKNLAVLLSKLGRYEEADPLLQEALRIREELLGPDDPLTVRAVCAVADHYRNSKRMEQAADWFARCLEYENGSSNPYPRTFMNAGVFFYQAGDKEEARRSFYRALELQTKAFGDSDPAIVRYLHNVGFVERDLGNHRAAKEHWRRILAIKPRDVATMTSLTNLYFDMKDGPQAAAQYRAVLESQMADPQANLAAISANAWKVAAKLADLKEEELALEIAQRAQEIEARLPREP